MADLKYPLGAGNRAGVHSASAKPIADITVDAVASGTLSSRDVMISADTLRLQAEFARQGGNPQLGENLQRAAELVDFEDDELLRFYEMLRPGRSTAKELDSLADALADRGAPRCAALVQEACAAYVRRGLIA